MDVQYFESFCKTHDDALVVGIATDLSPNVHNFVLSCQLHGFPVELRGIGTAWKGMMDKPRAYLKSARNLLSKGRHPVMVCADTYDMICTRKLDDSFFDPYIGTKTKKQILAAADIFCLANGGYLDDAYWKSRGEPPPKNRFFNAGFVSGYPEAIIPWCEWILDSKFTDDQIASGAYARTFPDRVRTDLASCIIRNMILEQPPFAEDMNGTGSFFVHCPSHKFSPIKSCLWSLYEAHIPKGICMRNNNSFTLFTPPTWVWPSLITIIMAITVVLYLWFLRRHHFKN